MSKIDEATRKTIEDLGTDSAKEHYRRGHECPDDFDPESRALCEDLQISEELCKECWKNAKQKRPC